MRDAKGILLSLTLAVATLVAVLGALAFLWIGLKSTISGAMKVGSFVLVLSLIILLLFGCGLCMQKRVVWVPALSLIVVLLCGLGLLLYLYGWLGGGNSFEQAVCNCFGSVEACGPIIAECQVTQAALATQQAPPAWWPWHPLTRYGR